MSLQSVSTIQLPTVQGTAAAVVVVVVVSFAVVVGMMILSMVGTTVHEPEMQVRPVAQRPIFWA